MGGAHRLDLGEIQETLLIPLYGRAVETRKPRGILTDPKSIELVESIDYDFGRFDGAPSLMGSAIRTAIFDVWVRRFIAQHPSATVIDVGTGLNTRFERVDNGEISWFDLDLPDVIDARRRFFADTGRRRMLAASVLDPGWTDVVRDSPGPYFVAAEAVLPYLDEAEVRQVFGLIADRLPGARVAFDTCGPWIIGNQHQHDVLSKVRARMVWACADPHEVEAYAPGVRLVESRTLARLPRELRPQAPLRYRLGLPVMRQIYRKRFGQYLVNLAEVVPRDEMKGNP